MIVIRKLLRALAAPALQTGLTIADPPAHAMLPTSEMIFHQDGTVTHNLKIPSEPVPRSIAGWTMVSQRFPDRRFWFGSGQPDGRAAAGFQGYGSVTDVHRSFFQFEASVVHGKCILNAELTLYGAYSVWCGATALSLLMTGPIDAETTWSTQPFVHGEQFRVEPDFCHGGHLLSFDVTGHLVEVAEQELPAATFGIAATDESDRSAYRKYGTAATGTAPVLAVTVEEHVRRR
jgi:hypothetical protein